MAIKAILSAKMKKHSASNEETATVEIEFINDVSPNGRMHFNIKNRNRENVVFSLDFDPEILSVSLNAIYPFLKTLEE